jgi:uncharacterized membrane protein
MDKKKSDTIVCQICGAQKKLSEVIPAQLLPESLAEMIRKTHPDWSSSGYICISDLNRVRAEYIKNLLETDKGELSALEGQVVRSVKEQEILSQNINMEFDQKLTFGGRLADRMSDYVGSWHFIIIFFFVLLAWVVINSVVITSKIFDPYPFILLNLVLSCVAAIQAPIILMSQNRLEARDRLRAEHDYTVNLKAELEIRHLHEDINHMLTNQWQRLMEIQQLHIELMQELVSKSPRESTT